VIYQVAVDSPQASTGVKTTIGLFQLSSNSGRTIVSAEQNMAVLGPTADGKGLYLLPRGQDPSFDHLFEVSLAEGTTTQLTIAGDPYAWLSPDRRWILTTMPQDDLYLYDLTAVPPLKRRIALTRPSRHARNLFWTADGYVYLSLLAGNFYDYDPDNPPASCGIWRLDPGARKLCQITPGTRQERQLLAVRPDGSILVTGDLRGTVLSWDTTTGQITVKTGISRGELYAIGFSADGQWLLLGHTTESTAILIHLASGTGESIPLPSTAGLVGWR